MKLKINGEFRTIEIKGSSSDLQTIISKLGLNPKLIVVEFNGVIISAKGWADQAVNDGDILEIVTIVGGGA